MAHPWVIAFAVVFLGACASAPVAKEAGPSSSAEPRSRSIALGLDAAALREAWGAPTAIRRISSPSAAGLVYEEWTWGRPGEGREALLVNGRVVDYLDPGSAAPPPMPLGPQTPGGSTSTSGGTPRTAE